MKKLFLLWIALGALALSVVFASSGEAKRKVNLKLKKFDGGFFSIEKPRGWEVVTAGSCADFAFLMYDPGEPLRQVFYFGEVGPVYMSEQQKQIDYQYMKMGGYPIL
ncbi:unnamed protein product, partial [marine sediment metagenome]